MKLTNILKTTSLLAIFAVSTQSCVHDNEWSIPPIKCENKFANATISLNDFVKMAPSKGTLMIPTDGADVIVEGYVVSSDESGNFYNTISIQDKASNPTVGLQIETRKVNNYTDMPVGAKIRIKANGLVLGLDRGTIKLGSADPNYPIGRIPDVQFRNHISGVCDNGKMIVEKIVPLELANLREARNPKYINMLVSVPNVQFSDSELGKTMINLNPSDDTDRTIEDNFGNTTVIRNSGFSTFGAQPVPTGNGKITFVVSRYNNNYQMLIRDMKDISFTNQRYDAPALGGTELNYTGTLAENFESYEIGLNTFPAYINDATFGSRYWQVKQFSKNKFIEFTAFGGTGNFQGYFIVPVDFTAANTLSFRVNSRYYKGNVLKVFTSTTYKPNETIKSEQLTDITSSFNIPSKEGFVNAGTHSFPTSLQGKGYILFRYEGAGNGVTTTIQIDDISIK